MDSRQVLAAIEERTQDHDPAHITRFKSLLEGRPQAYYSMYAQDRDAGKPWVGGHFARRRSCGDS